jgi:hypothetical protein
VRAGEVAHQRQAAMGQAAAAQVIGQAHRLAIDLAGLDPVAHAVEADQVATVRLEEVDDLDQGQAPSGSARWATTARSSYFWPVLPS